MVLGAGGPLFLGLEGFLGGGGMFEWLILGGILA